MFVKIRNKYGKCFWPYRFQEANMRKKEGKEKKPSLRAFSDEGLSKFEKGKAWGGDKTFFFSRRLEKKPVDKKIQVVRCPTRGGEDGMEGGRMDSRGVTEPMPAYR